MGRLHALTHKGSADIHIEGPFGGHTAAPLGDWHLGWNLLRASDSIEEHMTAFKGI